MTLCIIYAWWILCQHLCLSLPHKLLLLVSFDFFFHLFKMFPVSFLFSFVWNISSQHLGLFLPLIILLSFSIPFFLFRFFFFFYLMYPLPYFFTWCILCQHLGPTCHLLSLRHFILPWHSQVTLYLLNEVICIHCKFTSFHCKLAHLFTFFPFFHCLFFHLIFIMPTLGSHLPFTFSPPLYIAVAFTQALYIHFMKSLV